MEAQGREGEEEAGEGRGGEGSRPPWDGGRGVRNGWDRGKWMCPTFRAVAPAGHTLDNCTFLRPPWEGICSKKLAKVESE